MSTVGIVGTVGGIGERPHTLSALDAKNQTT